MEVARADDRGRLVRARREGVKAGETVALSEVFVWAYMPRETKRLCAHCGRALLPSTARRCRGGCAHTWYCPPPSTENRDGDSTLYKNEDGEIVEKMEKMMVDKSSCEREGDRYHGLGGGGAGCRSMRRYDAAVATGLRKGTLAPSLFGSQEATMFARLVIGVLTHPDRRQRALTFALEPNTHALSPTRLAQYEQMAEVVAASISLPRGARKVTKDDVVRLLCIQQCNAFGLSNGEGEMTGVALYPALSLFNHSCMPNCAAVDDGTGSKRVCAIKTLVAVPPGEELTISYIDLDLTRELRQDKLEESYAFRCTCARCRAPDADDSPAVAAHLRRITCGSCGGSLIPAPPGQELTVACNSCPLVVQRPNDGDDDADALSSSGTTVV